MELPKGSPTVCGLDPGRLAQLGALIDTWVGNGRISGAAVGVARHGQQVHVAGHGLRRGVDGCVPMAADAVFLVASVTKPVTALAAVMLIERGFISLDDHVSALVPQFAGGGKSEVTVRHLLTHSSGLPDMVPDNLALRQRHAPLADFVASTCRCSLLFRPGTRVSYQSTGILMLAEIVARVMGQPLPDFLRCEVFLPLGMNHTSLGWRDDLGPRVAAVDLPAEQQQSDWHWNSPYWRCLGAPWGGMFSTVGDLLVLLHVFLGDGAVGGRRVLSVGAARAMVADQTRWLPLTNDARRPASRWGLGWRLGWADLSSPAAFSHAGATGTLVGADPGTGLAGVVLTTSPAAPVLLAANAIHSTAV
jgi:CubicO group peptidase (beta-lactamase class C family)